MNPPVLLYEHAGSANHGCEAIARTMIKLLSPSTYNGAPILLSSRTAEDRSYSIGRMEKENAVRLLQEKHLDEDLAAHIYHYGKYKLTGDRSGYSAYRLKEGLKEAERQALSSGKTPVAVAIGGDNYCYPELLEDLYGAHECVLKRGWRSVLYGCSVEDFRALRQAQGPEMRSQGLEMKAQGPEMKAQGPEMKAQGPEMKAQGPEMKARGPEEESRAAGEAVAELVEARLLEDLMRYDLIVAREPLTYNTLLEAGIAKERLAMMPDPAFSLEKDEDMTLPEGFLPGGTVGLNLSPMAAALEGTKGAALESFQALIRHILDSSGESVALIPHVVKSGGDDREILKELYKGYEEDDRVILVPDADCTRLKRVISECSVFVGARTHATIAAYSSLVPTLVIGYSVKSRGIGKDIFGDGENYVRPVQELTDTKTLIEDYEKLRADEGDIRKRLKEMMPGYIEKSACNQARDMVFYNP